MSVQLSRTGKTSRTGGTDKTGKPGGPGRVGMAANRIGRISRRFPTVTRDTARPEGGQRAMGGEHAAPYRQWPLLAVCCGVLLGLLVAVAAFRAGALIIGFSLLGGAVLRRVMPSVGMLAVRSRFTDMVTYGALGVAITMLAMMAQPNPWVSLPILQDIVHFSVR